MSSLNVKYNNDKSRDYTNPNLPTGDTNDQLATLGGGLAGGLSADILLLATQPRLARERLAGEKKVDNFFCFYTLYNKNDSVLNYNILDLSRKIEKFPESSSFWNSKNFWIVR